MASVPEGPNAFFRLSPVEARKAHCFAVRRGDVGGRFDPSFHAPNEGIPGSRTFPVRHAVTLLRNIVKAIIQPNEFIREYIEESADSVPMLRAGNIRDGELNLSDLVWVPKATLAGGGKGFDASFIKEGDILITRTGAKAGETCVVPPLQREYIVSSHSIRVIPIEDVVEPKYLELFLLSRWGKAQITRLFTGAAQKQLQLTPGADLQISLPPKAEQLSLVDAMDAARAARRAKLAEADALLAGLDGFLLEILGLTAPPRPKTTFAVRTHQLTDALNPDRYRGLQLEKHLPFASTVGTVGNLLAPRCAPEGEGPEEQWDWIRIDDLPNQPWQVETMRTELGKNIEGTFFEVLENDILVARLGPTILNAKFVLCPKLNRRTVASSEFLVIRCAAGWQPEAVLWVLRTALYREIMYARSRGATPSRFRLGGDDLLSIPFPSMDTDTQTRIAAEARRCRDEARRLRAEAESQWQAAKRWFEEQLLGPAQP